MNEQTELPTTDQTVNALMKLLDAGCLSEAETMLLHVVVDLQERIEKLEAEDEVPLG